jgi:hypothetical protein
MRCGWLVSVYYWQKLLGVIQKKYKIRVLENKSITFAQK